ncbi:MAG: hypothetical protein HY016_02040 [Nitrosomonadales bacterium]|nr:hypothetical protein [Nitrosomonadales bacterium]
MQTIFTIPETLAVLEKHTGRTWTASELFDMVGSYGINLHAAAPVTAQTKIEKFVDSVGMVQKFSLPPADCDYLLDPFKVPNSHSGLAVLFPAQVKQLQINGETLTRHPSDHDEIAGENKVFIEPVRVTSEQVRVKAETLERILNRLGTSQSSKMNMLKLVKDQLRFDDEMRISYSSVRKNADGNPYYVTGARQWLKAVSVIGLITPGQFLAIMLEGMRNTNILMHGGLDESYEQEIITAWAGFIRDALHNDEISPRDDVTGLPIGKMSCAPHMDILDCSWCMSVSDAVKLAASKGAEIDFVAIAEHLYKIYFENEAATVERAAPAAKVETVPDTSQSSEDIEEQAAANNENKILAALFDPVPVDVLEMMFPADGKWKSWTDRASRNGLINAREGTAMYNPYKAGMWFVVKGRKGMTIGHCRRKLANHLPDRSLDEKYLLTGELD